ncbi:hypothetical protein [Streptomyces roseoverticillatus]|uniref:hypothetical protein n=1 Tax=Streptomyces roseoverticillatus TaxID=66429 RepID=UPI003F5416B1
MAWLSADPQAADDLAQETFAGPPWMAKPLVEQVEDAVPATLGVNGVPVIAGTIGLRGQRICGVEDGDVEASIGAAQAGAAVALPFGVPRDRRADLAGC